MFTVELRLGRCRRKCELDLEPKVLCFLIYWKRRGNGLAFCSCNKESASLLEFYNSEFESIVT